MVHFALLNNHIHFLVEARNRRALSRGMQGLLIRIAKALNKLWNRKGSVFQDRFYSKVMRTYRHVRNALCYVLHNARRHGLKLMNPLDPYTSGPWFDGWKEDVDASALPFSFRPVARARTYALCEGWKRHRLISAWELPAAAFRDSE